MSATRRARRSRLNGSSRVLCEPLELRRLLCGLHIATEPIVELRPDLVGVEPSAPEGGPEAADIVWTNRGGGGSDGDDGFDDVFDGNAETARRVVDAVIAEYERMITSFNYPDFSTTFNLTVNMGAAGLGGGAQPLTSLGGKPKSGTMTLLSGLNGQGSGYFIDPTSTSHAEFTGTITNAYAGDAQAGSPAAGLVDFYTVLAAEMAHTLGLFTDPVALPGWSARTSNTGITDNSEGGGVGTFWVFDGPSIKHLMTSNNGGPGGQSMPGAVHAAGPATINFNSISWTGAEDAGNAVMEPGRRYIVPDTLGLMFKDAYNYTVVTSGRPNFYGVLNPSNGQLLIRGEVGTDNTMRIFRLSGNLIPSVDPLADVPGTGALPGAGNLPAFSSSVFYPDVASIVVQGSSGNDTLIVDESGDTSIDLIITALPGSVAYNIPVAGITYSNIDGITLIGGTGQDTFDVRTTTLQPVTLNGGPGWDTYNAINTSASGPISIVNSPGVDTLNVNMDNVGLSRVDINSNVTLGAINLGVNGGINIFGTNTVLRTSTVTMAAQFSSINLTINSMIIDYTGASPLPTIQALMTSGYNGGNWTGSGFRTSHAFAGSTTSLGFAEATDLFGVFPATFSGQQVDNTSILIKYTYYGDARLDGNVNLNDFNALAANFGQSNRRWSQGDFDFSTNVTLNDFNRLASNFGQSGLAPDWLRGSQGIRSSDSKSIDGELDLLN